MNEPIHREDDVLYYTKEELRSVLLIEQGHLCCYCQRRIENVESTVIEHLYPRDESVHSSGRSNQQVYWLFSNLQTLVEMVFSGYNALV